MRKRKSRQRKSKHRKAWGETFAHPIDQGRYLQWVKKGAPLHKKQDPGRNLRASPAGRSVYGRHQCSEGIRGKNGLYFEGIHYGGGLAGLGAAISLSKAGVQCDVVEWATVSANRVAEALD